MSPPWRLGAVDGVFEIPKRRHLSLHVFTCAAGYPVAYPLQAKIKWANPCGCGTVVATCGSLACASKFLHRARVIVFLLSYTSYLTIAILGSPYSTSDRGTARTAAPEKRMVWSGSSTNLKVMLAVCCSFQREQQAKGRREGGRKYYQFALLLIGALTSLIVPNC